MFDVNFDNRKKNIKVKSFRKDFNWAVQQERYDFLQQFDTLNDEWNDQFSNPREICPNEEIERLLTDAISLCRASNDNQGVRFIDFVVRSGYKDEPELDEVGEILYHRTTPVHKAARFQYNDIVGELFEVYDRCVNYTDEFGYTHYDVAFEFDCEHVVEKFLEVGQDPNCLLRKSNSTVVDPLHVPLHVALTKRCRRMVRLLLKKGADPNLADAQGLTALHVICKSLSDDHDLARILFKHSQEKYRPVLVDAKDKLGQTPLHYAVTNECKELSIRVLLENGADPNVRNAKGLSPLQVICQGDEDNSNLVQMLIEISLMYKPVQVNVQDALGNTPLLRVLVHDRRNMFEMLLQKGADPNVTNKDGFTALHIICNRLFLDDLAEMVFELSHKKYQPLQIDTQDKNGNTPLHLALMMGKNRVADLLLKKGANPYLVNTEGQTPLHIFSKMNPHIKWIESFFDICDKSHHPMQVNIPNKAGDTPLHLALRCSNTKVSELLLVRGANPNFANAKGLTPLHIICRNNSVTARMLFELSHDRFKPLCVDAKDELGNTPLHEALLHKARDNAEFIMKNEANVNLTNERRSSPLHIICEYADLYDLAVLLFKICYKKHGTVQINAQNVDGNTPLHLALYWANKTMVEFLLRNGADPNSVNVEGSTPLHLICKEEKNSDMIEMFFDIAEERHQPVQINVADGFGRTPLQWAVSNFMWNAVDFLLDRDADLSNFVFPTANYSRNHITCPNDKFEWASGVMSVIESLEKSGYELYRSDALTIMKYFAIYQLFEKSENHDKSWRNDKKFKRKAKQIMIKSSLSLYDLIQLRPKEAVKLVTYADCIQFARSKKLGKLRERHFKACALHLCEKMTRTFFLGWAMEFFLEVTHCRLPLLCCDMIIEYLANKDLCNIGLAYCEI